MQRVATWSDLEDKNTGKKFFFLNTHLDHMGEVARHGRASLVLEQAKIIEFTYNRDWRFQCRAF